MGNKYNPYILAFAAGTILAWAVPVGGAPRAKRAKTWGPPTDQQFKSPRWFAKGVNPRRIGELVDRKMRKQK